MEVSDLKEELLLLRKENKELRELCTALLGRLIAADEATDMGFADARMREWAQSLGVTA